MTKMFVKLTMVMVEFVYLLDAVMEQSSSLQPPIDKHSDQHHNLGPYRGHANAT